MTGKKGAGTSGLEWLVAIVSALIVLGAIGSLLYGSFTDDREPPRVEVQVDSIGAAGDVFLVRFQLHNQGAATAAGLVVEGTLEGPSGTMEKSEVTLDYLPGNGSRQAGLYFTRDPRRYELRIRAVGYSVP